VRVEARKEVPGRILVRLDEGEVVLQEQRFGHRCVDLEGEMVVWVWWFGFAAVLLAQSWVTHPLRVLFFIIKHFYFAVIEGMPLIRH
jgi:hypothetical protein